MTVKEAADKLGYTTNGVQKMIERGTLAAKRHGHMWNVSAASVAKILKQREQK